jgi:hypothetical protein
MSLNNYESSVSSRSTKSNSDKFTITPRKPILTNSTFSDTSSDTSDAYDDVHDLKNKLADGERIFSGVVTVTDDVTEYNGTFIEKSLARRQRLFSKNDDDDDGDDKCENNLDIRGNTELDMKAVDAFKSLGVSFLVSYFVYPFTYQLFNSNDSDDFSVMLGIFLHILIFVLNVAILGKFNNLLAIQCKIFVVACLLFAFIMAGLNFSVWSNLLTKRMGTLMDAYTI